MFCPIIYTDHREDTDRAKFFKDQNIRDEALKQWKKDGSGPWAKYGCEYNVGWFKLDGMTEWDEYKALPTEVQAFLMKDTIPHYELMTHFPIHWFIPDFPADKLNYQCLVAFYYNSQSAGEVTLQSADPDVPLKFDPKFLASPFDRRVAIEALRAALRIASHDAFASNHTMMSGPHGTSDEDLLAYWGQALCSSYHPLGTLKMGDSADKGAVVDQDFRLMGIDGLRVADMSVVPILPSGHVQSVAYMTGMACAEKLITEYKLG